MEIRFRALQRKAHGLTLEEVAYPEDAELGDRAQLTRARRVADG